MSFLTKEKFLSAKWFRAVLLILIGTFIMSVGFVFFISPYRFAPGGVYGIAIVLHHLFNLPTGMVALIIDIPLTIVGIKILGPRFGWKTVLGFVSLAIFVDLLTYFQGDAPLVEDAALLSAIFGGVLIGIGLGLVFKSRATSGGSDIIAMIIGKYTRLPLGQLMIYVDSVIVLISLIAFKDWTIPLYSWIVIYITGKVVDLIIEGMNFEKSLFIISEKHELIRLKIIDDLKRGGTYIPGRGMFDNDEKSIIFTTVNRRELGIIKDYIKEVDPNAFISVMNTQEILGKGFKSILDSAD
jgi:uncharacterized membrane-anchored protein YitT (DUF2179 family)